MSIKEAGYKFVALVFLTVGVVALGIFIWMATIFFGGPDVDATNFVFLAILQSISFIAVGALFYILPSAFKNKLA